MPRATARVRVPFVDVDSSDRIHYTAMMRYWEVAEHELMRGIGMPYGTALQEIACPRVHVSADFKGAVVYDDLLDIEARVASVGRSSWTVAFTARHAGDAPDAPILADGRMTIVVMDPATKRPIPIPANLRAALNGE